MAKQGNERRADDSSYRGYVMSLGNGGIPVGSRRSPVSITKWGYSEFGDKDWENVRGRSFEFDVDGATGATGYQIWVSEKDGSISVRLGDYRHSEFQGREKAADRRARKLLRGLGAKRDLISKTFPKDFDGVAAFFDEAVASVE